MAWVPLPIRTSNDANSAADINTLMENIRVLAGNGSSAPDTDIQTLAAPPTSYAPYYVQSSAPSSPYHGWLWYDTDDNKLYQYNAYKSDWVEIDWQTAIKATPEWQAGKLQISSGMLQIADGHASPSWYDCYPLVGARTMVLQDTSKKYYLPHGHRTEIASGTTIPIVYHTSIRTQFMLYYTGQVTIYPSGVTTRTVIQSTIAMSMGSGTLATAATSGTYHLIADETYNYGHCLYSIGDYITSVIDEVIYASTWSNKLRANKCDKATTDYYIGTSTLTITSLIVERII